MKPFLSLVVLCFILTSTAACDCRQFTACVTGELVAIVRDSQHCHRRSCKGLQPSNFTSAFDDCSDADVIFDALVGLRRDAGCLLGGLCRRGTSTKSFVLDMLFAKLNRLKTKQLIKFVERLGSGTAADMVAYDECVRNCDRTINFPSVITLCSQSNRCALQTNMIEIFITYGSCKIDFKEFNQAVEEQCLCLQPRVGFEEEC